MVIYLRRLQCLLPNRSLFLIALSYILTGCPFVAAAPNASPINIANYAGTIKVACVGDSTTADVTGDPSTESYPAVLQSLLGSKFDVRNYGSVGYTAMRSSITGYGYTDSQNYTDAIALNPDVVIIMLGANDSKYGAYDPVAHTWQYSDTYVADLESLVSTFANLSSHPRIWISPPMPAYGNTAYGIRGSLISDIIVNLVKQRVAVDRNIPVLDLNTPMLNQQQFFTDDVHPIKSGNAVMAKVAYSYLTGAPLVSPVGGIFLNSQTVTLTPIVSGTSIYYTLDGSEPTTALIAYLAPFTITTSQTVRAKAFGSGVYASPDPAISFDFTATSLQAASAVSNSTAGLKYAYYTGASSTALDDPIAYNLTPTETGTTPGLGSLPHSTDPPSSSLLLTGYLKVPTPGGLYTFTLASYDTSVLTIDGQVVINHGGDYNLTAYGASGQIALASGNHVFSLLVSHIQSNYSLSLRWNGPSVTLQGIPNSAFCYAGGGTVTVPSAPTGLAATAGNAQVSLAWNPVTGATGYNVYRGTTPGGEAATPIATGLTVANYTDTTVVNGTAYYYTVKAANSAGTSSASNEANATPTAGTTGAVIANGSFETPAQTAAPYYTYNPTGGTWVFAGNSGIEANASGFGSVNVPDGSQAAFLQGQSGSNGTISQTVTFTAGTYQLNFQAAQRTTYGGTQSFDVYYDTTKIGSFTPASGNFVQLSTNSFTASAGSHTLKFVGTSTTGDNTAFIDKVSLATATPTNLTIANAGFETPTVANYAYNPTGGSWTFTAQGNNTGSGIAANNSNWGNPNAPDGVQIAFVQQNGSISQSIAGFATGTYYMVQVQAAQRSYNPGGNQSVQVLIDGTLADTLTPSGTAFSLYKTKTFTVTTAGSHTLKFLGTNTTGDSTAFLDSVVISH